MNFRRYTVLYFALLGTGIAIMVLLVLRGLASSIYLENEGKRIGAIGLIFVGSAFLVNTLCGLQHKRMWVRGGMDSQEKSGRTFYIMDVTGFLVLGIFTLILAIKIWTYGPTR